MWGSGFQYFFVGNQNLTVIERPRLLVRGRLLLVPVVAFRPVQNLKAIWTADHCQKCTPQTDPKPLKTAFGITLFSW